MEKLIQNSYPKEAIVPAEIADTEFLSSTLKQYEGMQKLGFVPKTSKEILPVQQQAEKLYKRIEDGEDVGLDYGDALLLGLMIEVTCHSTIVNIKKISKTNQEEWKDHDYSIMETGPKFVRIGLEMMELFVKTFEENKSFIETLVRTFYKNGIGKPRLNIKSEKVVIRLINKNEMKALIVNLFAIYRLLVISINSEFAKQVWDSGIFNVIDCDEFCKKVKDNMDARKIGFNLRECIVMYWLLDLNCKMYLTDIGDFMQDLSKERENETPQYFDNIRSGNILFARDMMKNMKKQLKGSAVFMKEIRRVDSIEVG